MRKGMMKSVEQNGVVDGLEGGGEFQQIERGHLAAVCCIRKIGCQYHKSRFCAVVGPVSRLQGPSEVVRSEVFIDLGQYDFFLKQFGDDGQV